MAEFAVPAVKAGVPAQSEAAPAPPPFIQVVNVSKYFPGVTALSRVSLTVESGEVHCWIGENGAGKSTLIKILAGAQSPDDGQIQVNGDSVELHNPLSAQAAGLSFIFQELNVVEGLTVADNITLGHEPVRRLQVDTRRSNQRASAILSRIGFGNLDPDAVVSSLSIAEKQAVMIARALNLDARVIFMDEATAALDQDEVDRLFNVIETLKNDGRSVVYVSHRLTEVSKLADRITVFKDGSIVGTYGRGDLLESDMVRLMVGREIADTFPAKSAVGVGTPVLQVRHASNSRVKDVSFEMRRGEILGVAGLVGSGRTELLSLVFGIDPATSGSIVLNGRDVRIDTPKEAIKLGVGLVPENRRTQGIVSMRSVEENLTLTWSVMQGGRGWRRRSRQVAAKYVSDLRIKTASLRKAIGFLSGGNQQKVIVGRWLAVTPHVLLLDEPTKGIDVGAKADMYQLINSLALKGMAVLVVSSELPELLGLSHRIIVMRDGRLSAILNGDCSEEEIMHAAMLDEQGKGRH